MAKPLGSIVIATVGNSTIAFPVHSTWSFMAANDPKVYIGLGDEKSIKDIKVLWTDGTTTTYDSFDHGFHILQQQVQ